MSVLAVIQAREGSSRLPKKVLLPLGSTNSLEQCYSGVVRAQTVTDVVIATGSNDKNKDIIQYCKTHAMNIFPGPELDVLTRFYDLASLYKPEHIVRVTADCPLIRSDLIDQCVEYLKANSLDYVCLSDKFAEGFDVEVFTYSALCNFHNWSVTSFEREHVTISRHSRSLELKTGLVTNGEDHSYIRLTLDHVVDYDVLREIFFKNEDCIKNLKYDELISLLTSNHADLLKKNQHILRNEALYY